MDDAPLISVIIPFYQVENYLAEAIDSVLHQHYTHWELLLLDDGSRDRSTEIALRYAARYPDKIRYYHHPDRMNRGLPATRNLGVKHAHGQWLALLDADDYWLPDKLAHQMAIAGRHPEVSMICGASLYWYSWADPDKQDVVIPVGAQQDTQITPPSAAVTLYPLGKGAAPCPCSVIVKTEAALRYGGFEEQFKGALSLYEDQAFFMKIYLGEPIYVSSQPMDRYRQRPDSIMAHTGRENRYHEIRHFYLRWLSRYLQVRNIHDPAVEERLRKALQIYQPGIRQGIKNFLLRLKGN
jgi:glycosyltransferase involved in cell wall biosynthesis